MLGPIGMITVNRSFTCFDNCDKDFNKISELFMQEELIQLKELRNHTLLPMK
jgi:hypothetical protein